MSVTGVLLVGGGSRRFGSPKALARFRGQTLAEHCWDALAWCDERLAVGKRGGPQLPFPVLEDESELQAPIVGVVAGLRAAAGDVCVVLPVDCPLIGETELRALAHACRDAAVPQTGPLPGAYGRSALWSGASPPAYWPFMARSRSWTPSSFSSPRRTWRTSTLRKSSPRSRRRSAPGLRVGLLRRASAAFSAATTG